MNFFENNQELFQTNSAIHSVNTRSFQDSALKSSIVYHQI